MIAIVHTSLSWSEDVSEAMKSAAFVADWSHNPDGPFLEMEVDESYTMDDFVADMKELIDLGSFGEIVLVDTCSDYPLIKVSISHGVINAVAFHRQDIRGAFKLARRVNLNEI